MSIAYDSGATGELPKRLWLKTCQGGDFGPSEVLYYTRDYVDVPDAPVLHAYDAMYDDSSGAYHVLLDDISDSHRLELGQSLRPSTQRSWAVNGGTSRAVLAYKRNRISIGAVIPDACGDPKSSEPGRAGLEQCLWQLMGST